MAESSRSEENNLAMGIIRKLFGERNRLSGFIFTEAVVKEFKIDGDMAILIFVDYCDTKWEVRFFDVSEVWSSDFLLAYEIMSWKNSRTEAGWKTLFYDDDGELMFCIVYENVELCSQKG